MGVRLRLNKDMQLDRADRLRRHSLCFGQKHLAQRRRAPDRVLQKLLLGAVEGRFDCEGPEQNNVGVLFNAHRGLKKKTPKCHS